MYIFQLHLYNYSQQKLGRETSDRIINVAHSCTSYMISSLSMVVAFIKWAQLKLVSPTSTDAVIVSDEI